jgi:hypothetical protein
MIDRRLRECFLIEDVQNPLHRVLCGIENTKLYFTTNYDDVIEKALQPRNPHFIVNRGDGDLWINDTSTKPRRVKFGELFDHFFYDDLRKGSCGAPIVFKLHGSINRADERHDSYLITMDDYLNSLDGLAPYVESLLEGKDILVLGYGLVDWNLRIILRLLKIIGPALRNRVWVIVGREDQRQEIWQSRNLTIYPSNLGVFAQELQRCL